MAAAAVWARPGKGLVDWLAARAPGQGSRGAVQQFPAWGEALEGWCWRSPDSPVLLRQLPDPFLPLRVSCRGESDLCWSQARGDD